MTQMRFPRRTKRGREWFPSIVNLIGIASSGGQANHILDTGMVLDEKKDSTIVRMLIDLSVSPNSSTVPLTFAMGITMMNADAHAAGALPEPGQADVEDADWMWSVPQARHDVFAGLSPFARTFILDIHSKRVYNARTDLLALIVDNFGSSPTINVIGSVKTLILDPP